MGAALLATIPVALLFFAFNATSSAAPMRAPRRVDLLTAQLWTGAGPVLIESGADFDATASVRVNLVMSQVARLAARSAWRVWFSRAA